MSKFGLKLCIRFMKKIFDKKANVCLVDSLPTFKSGNSLFLNTLL